MTNDQESEPLVYGPKVEAVANGVRCVARTILDHPVPDAFTIDIRWYDYDGARDGLQYAVHQHEMASFRGDYSIALQNHLRPRIADGTPDGRRRWDTLALIWSDLWKSIRSAIDLPVFLPESDECGCLTCRRTEGDTA